MYVHLSLVVPNNIDVFFLTLFILLLQFGCRRLALCSHGGHLLFQLPNLNIIGILQLKGALQVCRK